MATVRPFCPYRYNPALFPELAALVAPPYDVIGPEEQKLLHQRHPLNVVRLILSAADDPYESAAKLWQQWRQEHYIVQEPEPCIVFSVERFSLGKEVRERTGVYAAVGLEAFGSGKIRPHERTFSAPKEDRLRLLRACRANLSPIFGVYPDHAGLLERLRAWCERRKPEMRVLDTLGTEHRLWFIREARWHAAIRKELAEEEIIIADGHHRYETALAYCEEVVRQGQDSPDAGHRFVLMYLTSMEDPGLAVLPTHRVLQTVANPASLHQRIEQHFEVRQYPLERAEEFFQALDQGAGRHCLGLGWGGSRNLELAFLRDEEVLRRYAGDLAPAVRELDVTLLDRVVLQGFAGIVPDEEARAGRLWYTHSDREAVAALSQGAAAVFFMRPPRMADILAVCRAGQVMPQKSTYFYPKLLSGLLFQAVDEPLPPESARTPAQMAR
ncbi:MAG: DUF1015 domain-containing protein [Candidatus Binatia bacterium]|nr:DUF1015 domain-containing protein [Candidatus Binatia bacterium]